MALKHLYIDRVIEELEDGSYSIEFDPLFYKKHKQAEICEFLPNSVMYLSIDTKEIHIKNGKLHNENGPAIRTYNDNFWSLSWYIDGQWPNGLQYMAFYQNKIVYYYIHNNASHRDYAPACAFVKENGEYTERWHIRNKNITDDVKQWIKDNDLPHWSKWDDNIKIMFKLRFNI